jgi:hypothetical protein
MSGCDFIIAVQRLLFIIALWLMLWHCFMVAISALDIAMWPGPIELASICPFGMDMVELLICADKGADDNNIRPIPATMNLA